MGILDLTYTLDRGENIMPTERGSDSKGPFYRWGKSGAKYHYTPGNENSRKRAKEKADKQGRAIRAGGYRG